VPFDLVVGASRHLLRHGGNTAIGESLYVAAPRAYQVMVMAVSPVQTVVEATVIQEYPAEHVQVLQEAHGTKGGGPSYPPRSLTHVVHGEVRASL